MKINGIKCDTCDKMCNTDGLYDHLPQGWFTLEPGQGGGFVDCKHFCSLECLRLWIPKPPVVSEFVGQDEPETTKITLSDRFY